MQYQNETIDLITSVAHQINLHLSKEIKVVSDEITVEQYILLTILKEEDGIRPTRIADKLGKAKGTVTSILTTAAKTSLVAITDDETRKNSRLVYITQKGIQLHEQIQPIFAEAVNKALEPIRNDGTDIDQINVALRKSLEAIQAK